MFRKEENKLLEENASLKTHINELENKIAELSATIAEYKTKEQSISSAIAVAVERSNQLEDTRKKIFQLDIQRLKLLYIKMEQVLNDLCVRIPDIKKDPKIKDLTENFKQAIYNQTEINLQDNANYQQKIKEDPVRKLLSNVIHYIDGKKSSTALKIGSSSTTQPKKTPKTTTRNDKKYSKITIPDFLKNSNIDTFMKSSSSFETQINTEIQPANYSKQPSFQASKQSNQSAETTKTSSDNIAQDSKQVPKNSQSAYAQFATTPSSSGFDINEALHPTDSLEKILEAFDLGE